MLNYEKIMFALQTYRVMLLLNAHTLSPSVCRLRSPTVRVCRFALMYAISKFNESKVISYDS